MPHTKSCSAVLGVNSTEVLGSSQLLHKSEIETISKTWKLFTLGYKKPLTFPDEKHHFPRFTG